MKKTLLSIVCILAGALSIQAQTLYGTTQQGGTAAGSGGTINKFLPATNTLTVLKSFKRDDTADGSLPAGRLVLASNGKLYGIAETGGHFSSGVLFSYDPNSLTYTKLLDFESGAIIAGSLMQANNGKLYGMAQLGGNAGDGFIFSFDPVSATYSKLLDFNFTNGANPLGNLMQASDGKLYGMTSGGGNIGEGVIFSIDPSTGIFTKLLDLDGTNGAIPQGGLIQASDGKLYGMTMRFGSGGAIVGEGVIFSFDIPSLTYKALKLLDDSTGSYPYGDLMQATDGKLYGLTSHGGTSNGGVIFSFDPSTATYSRLKSLDNTHGTRPLGNLLQASDGKLYGTTNQDGSAGDGNLFSFDPATSTYASLLDFNNANGAFPFIGSEFVEVKTCANAITYYKDHDGDGYGNHDSSVLACSQPAGYVTNDSDCNDNNAAIHTPVTYYRDADGDGYGDANNSIGVCETIPPPGYVNNNYDCDDYDKLKKAGNERVVMCHNGKSECVIAKEIQKRLEKGWTLGPCTPALTTIDVAENVEIYGKEQSIPRQYKLSNYPNPFKGTSTIIYELPFDSKVSIKVYDVIGRVLTTLVNGDKKAGTYTIDFNAGNLSKGSLYYRIIATSKDQQFEQTNKMIQIQ